jgi:gliding motility-associated lipoprotein GldH
MGCGPEVIYDRAETLPAEGWSYADSVAFEFAIPDTVRNYDLVLMVEHDQTFPYQNFYVNIHTDFPNGRRTTQLVSLQLAGDFGAWLGNRGEKLVRWTSPSFRGRDSPSPGHLG